VRDFHLKCLLILNFHTHCSFCQIIFSSIKTAHPEHVFFAANSVVTLAEETGTRNCSFQASLMTDSSKCNGTIQFRTANAGRSSSTQALDAKNFIYLGPSVVGVAVATTARTQIQWQPEQFAARGTWLTIRTRENQPCRRL
jgi:hypothetical protein